jgi:integrase
MSYKLIPPGKRRNRHYWLRGTIAGERVEVSTGCETRQATQAWAADYVARLEGQRVPGIGEVAAFERAAELYKAAHPHLSKGDIRLVDAVAKYFGDKGKACHEVVHADLVAASDELKPGRSASTKNRKVIGPAAAVLHYAANNQWCTYQRIEKFWVSRKSNREPARDEDLALLIANVEAPPRRKKFGRKADYNVAFKRLLLLMLYELGLRIGHLLTVRWDDVDLQAARLKVRIPKSDEIASLELSPVIVTELANLTSAIGADRPALGRRVDRRGRLFPWTTNRGVHAWLKPLTDRLGIKYTPHMSRHKLATDAQVLPDKKAAELGVWKDPRSLHRYQHVRPEAIPGRSAATLLALPAPDKRKVG